MKKYHLTESPEVPTSAVARWKSHPFYASSVVLGVDVGIEGIGVAVRKGQEIVYAASWIFDWPKSLADRRGKRAWRHCRKNLQIRLKRLEDLFQKHGLPWFSDRADALLRSDPFELRWRGITSHLGSKEALSIAIRHVVAHRGYDYSYFSDEGEYPWGSGTDFKNAIKGIMDVYLAAPDADKLAEECLSFGWTDEQIGQFSQLVESRRISGQTNPIRERLAAYVQQKKRHLRDTPKGIAFPRSLVWSHLEELVRRHAHLIDSPDEFLSALAIKPDEDKSRSIFFYHRKTPGEMRQHFEKKTKKCAFSDWLGLGSEKPCDKREVLEIRRFLLLEFLASRRVEIGATANRVSLPPALVQEIIEWQTEFERARANKEKISGWKEAKKVLDSGLKTAFGSSISKSSDFNKAYLEALKDLLCPTAANRKTKSNLCKESAARLFLLATEGGFDPEAIRTRLKDYYRKRREATYDPSGRYPQVEFLLGAVARKSRQKTSRHPNRKQKGETAVDGRLQLLFRELASRLGGKFSPDYCVVEVIGDPPRSENGKRELLKEIQHRREMSEKAYSALGVKDTGSRTTRLRLKLWRQQGGVSPFTGKPLGEDPLSASLQLAHLFPDSRGGLFTDENLVLTTTDENNKQLDRTPREAATDLAGSWEEMQKHARQMKWPAVKWEIFCWDKPEPPDFGNTTRMSQLARQLYVGVGEWMGLPDIPDPTLRENRRAERIGTPAGHLTATARAAWKMPRKDRSDLVHHAVDAVTLSFIPPREGMNSVRCGGIFFDERLPESGKIRLAALPLGPDPEAVAPIVADDAPRCPVVHFPSASSKSSIHDQTILGITPEGKLASRVPFAAEKDGMDTVSLKQRLADSGIPTDLIPAESKLDRWLTSPPETKLILNNGQVVKRETKFASKETAFFPGLGLSAKSNGAGNWQTIKIFNAGKYQGLEVFRSWNPIKRKWEFSLRRVPDRRAIESLFRTAFSWLKFLDGAALSTMEPVRIGRLKEEATKLNANPRRWHFVTQGNAALALLKQFVEAGFPIKGSSSASWAEVEAAIYGDPLPDDAHRIVDPSTGKPALLRKGDAFLIVVTGEGKRPESGRVSEKHWYRVTAIMSGGRIKLKAMRRVEWGELYITRNDIALLFQAKQTDDPPSDPSE
ncbi:MAG: hypothetical protein NTV93_14010 [Verrucomicrobia bacterium]|nr:hypothetical protein [Verrucomicrobiota bacterium]